MKTVDIHRLPMNGSNDGKTWGWRGGDGGSAASLSMVTMSCCVGSILHLPGLFRCGSVPLAVEMVSDDPGESRLHRGWEFAGLTLALQLGDSVCLVLPNGTNVGKEMDTYAVSGGGALV